MTVKKTRSSLPPAGDPCLPEPVSSPAPEPDYIHRLISIMARLRGPDGCPWDHEQTHESLRECLLEETAELIDAINDRNDADLIEELGDVLLQVVFHCQIAAEQGRFNLQDTARQLCQKLIRRHPHVFAGRTADTPDDVVQQWNRIKQEEKKRRRPQSQLDGIPRSLSALHRAHKIQLKAAQVGFDWPSIDGVIAKIEEELAELREAVAEQDDQAIDEEVGDLLFAVVNLSRWRKKAAEDLLHATIEKFYRRFQMIEQELLTEGKTPEQCSLEHLDRLWEQVKSSCRDEKINETQRQTRNP